MGIGFNYGNGNGPLQSYSGRVKSVKGKNVVASVKFDPNGLERDVVMALDEIESKRPIKAGDLICVDLFRPGGEPGSKGVKFGDFVEEKKYIVN